MIRLAIDVGIRNVGYAVLSLEDNQLIYTASDCLVTSGHDLRYQLLEIHTKLLAQITRYRVSNIIYEEPVFARSSKLSCSLNQVTGIILLLGAVYNLPVKVYSAKEVKKILTGDYKATKVDVQNALSKYLPELSDIKFATDHESDAIGIGIVDYLSCSGATNEKVILSN